MYEFARGPLVWIAMLAFVGGSLYKIVSMLKLARSEKSVLPIMSFKFGLRSLAHWLVPFGSENMRLRPLFTLLSFAFHICVLLTPLLVMGHAVLWHESWRVSWWSLPPDAADTMTLIVVLCCAVFLIRRIAMPEVRNVTGVSDFLLLLIVAAPFVTGFLAHWQLLPYEQILTAHIITGALWLIAIPFTRLSHMIWFVFTRSYMGSEFGSIRRSRDW